MERREFIRLGAIVGGASLLGIPALPLFAPRRLFNTLASADSSNFGLEKMLMIHAKGGISSRHSIDAFSNTFIDRFNSQVADGGLISRYNPNNDWVPNTSTQIGTETVVPITPMGRNPHGIWVPKETGFVEREFGPAWSAIFGQDYFYGNRLGIAVLDPEAGHDVGNKIIVCGATNPYFKSWSALIAAKIAEANRGTTELPFVILNGDAGFENVTLNKNYEIPFIFGSPSEISANVQSPTGVEAADQAINSTLATLTQIGKTGSDRLGIVDEPFQSFSNSLAGLRTLGLALPDEDHSPRYLFFYLRILAEILRASRDFFGDSDCAIQGSDFNAADLGRGELRAGGGSFGANDYAQVFNSLLAPLSSLPEADFFAWEKNNRKNEEAFVQQQKLRDIRAGLNAAIRANGSAASIMNSANIVAQKLATALFLFTRNNTAVCEAYFSFEDTHDRDAVNALNQVSVFGGVKAVLDIAAQVLNFGGSGKTLAELMNGSVTTEFDRLPNLYVNSDRTTPGTNHGSSTPVVYFGPRFVTGRAFGGTVKGTPQEIQIFSREKWGNLERFAPLPIDTKGRIARPEDGGILWGTSSIAPTMLRIYDTDVPSDQKNASQPLDFLKAA